ncbi:phage tail spike protein [Streptococcus suis]
MIYLFDKDEKLIKIVRKSAVKTALQKYALTTERYVSDRLTVELKGLNADELEQVEYMAIQTMEDAHTFHYFYVAQKFSDSLTTLIGVQSGIEELRKSPVYDKRPKNAFARDVITDLLAGTNWQARFVGETAPHSTNFYYTSVFDALKKVCEVWDLEMQFFVEMNGNRIGARYIDFKQRIGEAVGKRVVYGHNALQILQEVERTNIFTALIGRGKGEETGAGYGRKITFEDVTWSTNQGKPVDKPTGQKYLELPLMTRQYGIKNADGSMRPKIGFVDFSEEENPEVLIERTYRALIDAARPQLTLKTSSVYLKGVKVGDTIRVVRHDKKLDYDTRIFEITFNRLNNQSSDIKLGDRIGESSEAKVQTIADKAVEQFVNNEFSNFVQNLPDYLPSADGFNNNWYGTEDPTVKYPGKVLINDIWYKPDPEHEGHKIMLRWTGEVWEEILRTYDSEALRDRIAEEITQVNASMQAQSEEHDRQVADILSKTQSIESLANQAKTDAANAVARANQAKTEAIADARAQVATVSQALNTAKTELQTAIASADQKARDSQASATALRNDLNLQASKILAQAQAQTALTSRVTSVETLADGTRSTVAELSKTVNKATGDIATVSSRTKTVEDTLSQTRTQYEALTQTVNTQTGQIESINRKTADLQSGIDGVTERFENLRVGSRNYLRNASFVSDTQYWYRNRDPNLVYNLSHSLESKGKPGLHMYSSSNNAIIGQWKGVGQQFKIQQPANTDYVISLDLAKDGDSTDANIGLHFIKNGEIKQQAWFNVRKSEIQASYKRYVFKATSTYDVDEINVMVYVGYNMAANLYVTDVQLEVGNIASDFQLSDEDLRSDFATYVRTATENSAELVRRIETADGKAVDAKSYAQQTAEGFKSRIESLETYKDAEGTRAQTYFTAAKNETAKQLTAERAVIANNYLAKSIYDEDARGTTLKLNEIKSTADTAKQNLATYQNTVDRKLEELTSSTQTLDGKINTASSKVDTVAGQIRTEISSVEGKIPTETSGNLLLNSGVGWSNVHDKTYVLGEKLLNGKVYTIASKYWHTSGSTGHSFNIGDGSWRMLTYNRVLDCWVCTFTINANVPKGTSVRIGSDPAAGLGSSNWVTLVKGSIALSQWQPAGADLIDELSTVKTTIAQTSQGVEQLSTSLATTDNKVSTAETKINQLIGDVSSKVSQTDYNTLTGRMASAETAITQNAQEISRRLTSTQVEQAINAKGFATTTVVESKVRETSESFSRTISEVEAKIPTEVGTTNLIRNGQFKHGENNWSRNGINQGSYDLVHSQQNMLQSGLHFYGGGATTSYFGIRQLVSVILHAGTKITVSVSATKDTNASNLKIGVHFRKSGNIVNQSWKDIPQASMTRRVYKRFHVTFELPTDVDEMNFMFVGENSKECNLYITDVKVAISSIGSDWSPAPEDLATVTALHTVNDKVDSHTRIIGAVGTSGSILDNVSKVTQTAAGLVQEVSGDNGLKTQVSTLAGSYAIKSLTKAGDVLGQINLNKDGSVKIDGSLVQITGRTYIQDGIISAAKIGDLSAGKITSGYLDAARIRAGAIDGSKIAFDEAFFNGLTANQAYLKKLFAKDAFLTAVQAVNISASQITGGLMRATNGALDIDLNNAEITFKNNAKIRFLSSENSISRSVANLPKQFLRFETGSFLRGGVTKPASKLVIGANNQGIEDSESEFFSGQRWWQTKDKASMGELVADQVLIYSNGANRGPLVFNTFGNVKNFHPVTGALWDIGLSSSPFRYMYVYDIYLQNGVRLGQALKDLANRVGHNGWGDNIS